MKFWGHNLKAYAQQIYIVSHKNSSPKKAASSVIAKIIVRYSILLLTDQENNFAMLLDYYH